MSLYSLGYATDRWQWDGSSGDLVNAEAKYRIRENEFRSLHDFALHMRQLADYGFCSYDLAAVAFRFEEKRRREGRGK